MAGSRQDLHFRALGDSDVQPGLELHSSGQVIGYAFSQIPSVKVLSSR